MRLTFNKLSSLVFFAAALFLCSCGNKKTESKETETETKDTTVAESPGEEEMTEEQMKIVGIEVGLIENRNLSSVVKATGQLVVPPQNKALVNALVGGVIKRINVVEGQNIRKGQIVASIENPEFIKLQQEYLTSKDNIVYLEQEYERQKQLKDADAGIGKVYQQASANLAAERSKLLTLEKQLSQIHINPSQVSKGNLITQVSVLAPINGTVGNIKLSIGTYTDASSPIMEISNNATIFADLMVYEKDIPKVKVGHKVNFVLTNQENKQVSGTVYGINKSFEGENKAVIVHALINNTAPLNLIAGMYVSALIETGKQVAPSVPKDAIVTANDKQWIFILEEIKQDTAETKDEDTKSKVKKLYIFKKVEVITGVEELGYVEIHPLEDIPTDKKIVTKGAFYIHSKMQDIETNDLN